MASSKIKTVSILLAIFHFINHPVHSINVDFQKAGILSIERNLEIKYSGNKLRLQRIRPVDYALLYLPTFTMHYDKTQSIEKGNIDSSQHQLRLDYNQFLFDGLASTRALKLKQIRSELAAKNYENEIRTRILSGRSHHLSLILARDNLIIRHQSVNWLKQQVKMAKAQLHLGSLRKLDLLYMESSLKKSELSLLEETLTWSNALEEYREFLRLEGEMINISDNIDSFSVYAPDLYWDDLERLFFEDNPDRLSLSLQVKESTEALRITRLGFIPRMGLNTYVTLSDDKFFPRDVDWGMGLKIDMPLGLNHLKVDPGFKIENNGQRVSQSTPMSIGLLQKRDHYRKLRIAKVDMAIIKEQKRQLDNTLRREFNKKKNTLILGFKKLELLKEKLSLDSEKMDIQKKIFNQGQIDQSRFFEEYLDFIQQKQELHSEIAGYIVQAMEFELLLSIQPGKLGLYKYEI